MTLTQGLLIVLEEKAKELDTLNQRIFDIAVDTEVTEEDLNKEIESVDEYKWKFQVVKVTVARLASPQQLAPAVPRTAANRNLSDNSWKYKLPEIELKRFNGGPKEWLQFWSFFKRIQDDVSLSNEEKFQYLIQATVESS